MAHDNEPRAATADDGTELATLISGAFLSDPDTEFRELLDLVAELDRTYVISADGRLVATGATMTRELSVPGAVMPAGHVTGVAVAATHRRQGLLTRIMNAQLEDIRDRGEPLAVLWASEGPIYGRFGYGIAARHVEYKIATKHTELPGLARSQAQLTQVVPNESIDDFAAVYERVRGSRPGWSSRPGQWWKFLLTDIERRRHGASNLRGVLHRVDGQIDGYALWRVKHGWNESGPDGSVNVVEVVAENAGSYADLWRFLMSIDLSRTLNYSFAAVDEPLPYLVSDSGAVVSTMGPSLWVRLADVPAALSVRRYAAPVDVVIQVTDELLDQNTGRWRLEGGPTNAKCTPSDDAPDLELDVRDLGAIYLGGTSLQTLAAGGSVVEHTEGSVRAATTAFGWHRAPSAIEIF
jgi:predicted acetyltransferase